MNRVELIGRITRDPELRYTNNNIATCRFTLAVNRPFQSQNGEQGTDFINIVVWRKQAENVKNYLTQGSQVAIDGRIQTRIYDDNNGQKRYVTEVIADNVEFIGSRSSSNNSNNAGYSQASGPTPYDFGNVPEPKGTDIESNPFVYFGASIEISDDELPF